MKGNDLNNIRREARRHYSNKEMEYLTLTLTLKKQHETAVRNIIQYGEPNLKKFTIISCSYQ
jgi:hypothetical protein